ncbi:MAG: extracellular solute-binding protein [Nocardioides sp.]|uniref:extracellular solute-binding protein n=1 Tax=Nocardioides sp. TaxID=35761 RepID=UPI0039E2FA09
MRKSRILTAGALGIAATLALTACGGGGSSSAGGNGDASGGSTDGAGKTLVVWNMTGDLTDATMKAIDDEFTKQTGAEVKVQTQQWDNIATKVTTALATDDPPDVIELGNTDVGSFAATGGLLDLTDQRSTLQQGGTWLDGLAGPATVDGKLYAVPAFAATRTVIYRKSMWSRAGIDRAPTTYDELTADLDKVEATFSTTKDFAPFYLPGKYWYDGVQWVWDAGGEIATQDGDTWKGGLSGSAAQQGLADFKTFQNTYSTKASATLDTTGTGQPDQDKDIFAQGKTSAILGNAWEIGAITSDNPKIKSSDLGTFPFPGTSGHNQPVMLAGSDWGIAAKSQNASLAETWVQIAASKEIQMNQIVGQGWIPITEEWVKQAEATADPQQKAFFTAAQNSASTPAAASWATIEGDGAVQQFFSDVASGAKSPADAAKGFDDHLDSVLNGS